MLSLLWAVSSSAFIIRVIERAETAETVTEIATRGWFDNHGELMNLPSEIGHFVTTLVGANPGNLFASAAKADLPQASILMRDLIIFDMEKEPQPGDICIGSIGSRLFLTQINSRTFDERTPPLVMKQDYQLPMIFLPEDRQHRFHWHPLAYNDDSHDYFMNIADQERFQLKPLPRDFIAATGLRLIRALAF